MKLKHRIFLLCSPLMILPFADYWYLSQDVKGFVSEKGIVVGAKHTLCRKGKNDPQPTDCWYEVVEYKVDSSHTARILSDTAGSEPSIGDEVPILVNPGNRYIAVLSGFRGHWSSLLLVSVLSFCFVLFATLVAFVPAFGGEMQYDPKKKRK